MNPENRTQAVKASVSSRPMATTPPKHPSRPPHTQLPNVLVDYVMARTSPAEFTVLMYIVRHTIGFVDPDNPERRKEMDVISLKQFEFGVWSGTIVQDLGVGMSKMTIRNALDSLEKLGLIKSTYSCTKCLWRQRDDEPAPEGEEGKGVPCPRCNRTLARAWGMATLRPSDIINIMNGRNEDGSLKDKLGRIYHWNPELKRPEFEDVEQEIDEETVRRREEDLVAQAEEMRGKLWFPDLVERIVAQAEGRLKQGGKIRTSKLIKSFYQPVLEMQEQYVNYPPLVKHALAETARKGIAGQDANRNWFNYPKAICRNNLKNYTGAKAKAGTNAAVQDQSSLKAHERTVRDLLRRAADLNGTGQHEDARALLSDILSNARHLAPLFGGDVECADLSLREAFKQGVDYFVGIQPDPYGLNYYNEWTWPADRLPAGQAV